MPTVLSHPAVALLQTWFPRIPRRAIAFGAIATVLPDLDVVAFRFDIAYGAMFGHRGFSHSIAFALFVALAGGALCPTRRASVFAFVFLCALSHGVLDAMTDGGLGVAFFSPLSNERYFFPWRPIRVSPINPDRFLTSRAGTVLLSELTYVWLPCVALSLTARAFRRA